MTIFEKIKSYSLEELADFLDKNGSFDQSPWSDWFNDNYCSKCESVMCKAVDCKEKLGIDPWYGEDMECAYCELIDETGCKKCRFFPEMNDVPDNKQVIEMWLKETVPDEE